jgi:hypothetical protein
LFISVASAEIFTAQKLQANWQRKALIIQKLWWKVQIGRYIE